MWKDVENNIRWSLEQLLGGDSTATRKVNQNRFGHLDGNGRGIHSRETYERYIHEEIGEKGAKCFETALDEMDE